MSVLKIAIAVVMAAAAIYMADVGRPDVELNQSPPSSTAAASSDATKSTTAAEDINVTQVAIAALETLVKSLTEGAGVQMLNVELRSDLTRQPLYASMHAVAKKDANEGDDALIIPAALQFNDNTADASLRKGLTFIMENDQEIAAKIRAKSNRDFLVTISLLLETRKGKKSVWWPWIATFPSAQRAMDSLGYFASNDEFSCLPPRGQLMLSSWRQQSERFAAIAADICASSVVPAAPEPTTEENGKKKLGLTAPQLVQKLMCQVEKPQMDWAVGMVTSRSFNFVRYTTMFPILDILPYRINASLRPGKIHTEDDGQMVSIAVQASGPIRAGDALSFRTDLRDPVHALLSQGFHDENNFAEGYEVFMNWSPTVINMTGGKREGPRPEGSVAYPLPLLNCGSSHEANIVAHDGSFDEELLRCAELQVLVSASEGGDGGSDTTSSLSSAESYDFKNPTVRARAIEYAKHAVARTLGDSHAECVEVLSAGGSSFGRELALHLKSAKAILTKFQEKLDSLA